jgi:hypothetical protein
MVMTLPGIAQDSPPFQKVNANTVYVPGVMHEFYQIFILVLI